MKKEFEFEDLLADRDFIQWVLKPTQESDIFWTSVLENQPWKVITIERARKVILSINFREADPSQPQFDRVLEKVLNDKLSSTSERSGKARTMSHPYSFLSRAAAIFIIISSIVGALVLINRPRDVSGTIDEWVIKSNPKGQKSTFFLPDSSRITLNSESSLRYKRSFEKDRVVKLEGEAFFEIEKSDAGRFMVEAGDIQAVVLGTSFNVRDYPDEQASSVSLRSGKVSVQNAVTGLDIMLMPGEKSLFYKNSGTLDKVSYDSLLDLSWKDGVMVFQKSSLVDFIKTIERWYGVEVKIDGQPGDEWMISGKFNNESLKNVLESLRFARKLEYDLNENSVTLIFKI